MRPTEVYLRANQPFFLDKNDHFWVVASGEVEVYYVKVDENGELKSPRNYLYTARKGDVLFTLKTGEEFDEFSLIAVSPNSKLIEVHKYFAGRLDKEQLSNKIERWVTSLSVTLHQENKPKVYTDIASLETLQLKRKQIAYPSKGIVWGKVLEGDVVAYGEATRIENSESTRNLWFPISRELRIQAQGKKN
ncbi:MAG: NHLP bacteriocin export ABC transporter permease/ATPase subunit, partial [Bacteroidota bacterium]